MAGVTSLARSLLDLVFPPRCVNCHALGALLCENCRATIAIPQPPLCARCGRPLPATRSDHQCGLCASGHSPLIWPACAPQRSMMARSALRSWRTSSVARGVLAEPLGDAGEAYKRERLTAELVTHVPLHSARRRQRGYDQSHLMAREMARRLGLPFLPDAVKRVRATRASDTSEGR